MQIIMGFNFPLKQSAKETAGFDRYTTYNFARILNLLRSAMPLTPIYFIYNIYISLRSDFTS